MVSPVSASRSGPLRPAALDARTRTMSVLAVVIVVVAGGRVRRRGVALVGHARQRGRRFAAQNLAHLHGEHLI